MADNITLDPMSSGSSVATDNIGDVHHQLVKVEFGPDGAGTMVSQTNPLPVNVHSGGTINAGTIGTVGAVGQVHNAGTIQALPNIPGGTINAGTVAVTTPGTITSGSIAVTAGTIGTVASVAQVHNAGTIAGGTIGEVTNGSIRIPAGTVSVNTPGTITSGSMAITAGTIGTVANVAQVHNVGTIQGGTIRINTKPIKSVITIGSAWGTTSGTAGTLVAAQGAGTSIFINELSISNDGTSTLKAGLSFGTAQTGTAVVKMVGMGGNGGIEVAYPNAVGGHFANTPLVMWTTGSGTASFNVSYWVEAQ